MDNQEEYEIFVNKGAKSAAVKVKGNMIMDQLQAKINQEFHIPPQDQLFSVSRNKLKQIILLNRYHFYLISLYH